MDLDVDPAVQADIDVKYVTNGIRRVNEVRADHGWELEPILLKIAEDGIAVAFRQLSFTPTPEITEQVNARAVAWARDRAAELVGMRVLEDGSVGRQPERAVDDHRVDARVAPRASWPTRSRRARAPSISRPRSRMRTRSATRARTRSRAPSSRRRRRGQPGGVPRLRRRRGQGVDPRLGARRSGRMRRRGRHGRGAARRRFRRDRRSAGAPELRVRRAAGALRRGRRLTPRAICIHCS
jgi:hypothetical protein